MPRPWHFGHPFGLVPRLQAVPRQGGQAWGARPHEGDGERPLRAVQRLVEREGDRGLEVAAALGPRAGRAASAGAATSEQVGQDVLEAAEVAGGEAAGAVGAPAAAHAEQAAAVVLLALV